MVRRSQQNKRAERKATRHATEQLVATKGTYRPPKRELCREKRWEIPVDEANTVRLQFIIWRRDGRIVDFVVNLQVLVPDGFTTTEYFDCCHGHFHLHNENAGIGVESLHRLDQLDDVRDAFGKVAALADDRARIIRNKGSVT